MSRSIPKIRRSPSGEKWRRCSRPRQPHETSPRSVPCPERVRPMSDRPVRARGIAASMRRLRTARPSERREWLFALALLTPACLMLAVFVAYPFGRGIWLSFSDTLIGREGAFVGFSNFVKLWQDSIFQRTTQNTFIYTAVATLLKLALGMAVALMLNMLVGFKRLLRASMLLPWIIPTVLSTLA